MYWSYLEYGTSLRTTLPIGLNSNCFNYLHSCEVIDASDSLCKLVEQNTPTPRKLEFSSNSELESSLSSNKCLSSSSNNSSDTNEPSEFETFFASNNAMKEN